MIIAFKLSDITLDLFPEISDLTDNISSNIESIKDYFVKEYTVGPFLPIVNIEEEIVTIEVDTETIEKYQELFQKAVRYSEKGNFIEAKKILSDLIKKNPSVSEFYRLYGQIYEVEGDYEKAKENMVEALRWDPNNKYALVMMGNILSRYDNDGQSAIKFYNKCLFVDPNDYFALSNIGGQLAKMDMFDDAERYFNAAIETNDKYPNSHLGLGFVLQHRGDLLKAFIKAVLAMERSFEIDEVVYKTAYSLALNTGNDYVQQNDNLELVNKYAAKLKYETEKDIKIEESDSIDSIAITEYAELHDRNYHIVKYKPNTPAHQHFIMHELSHIDLSYKARKAGRNKLFMVNNEAKNKFIKDNKVSLDKLKNVSSDSFDKLVDSIYNGLTKQLYNAPIDLVIEKHLYDNYPENRPFQFVALTYMNKLYQDGYKKTNYKQFPQIVYESNIVLNIVGAFQLFDLFFADMYKGYPDYENNRAMARSIYNLYAQTIKEFKPGDEYELINKFAQRLKLIDYYKLINEEDRLKSSFKNVLDEILSDPFGQSNPNKENQIRNVSFKDNPAGSMAVTMYCLDALKTFDGKSDEFIQEVAFEIALLGTHGLNPYNNEIHYSLKSIPNKKFTALHLLCFEYTGFQHIKPEIETGLDFKEEYENAKQLFKNNL